MFITGTIETVTRIMVLEVSKKDYMSLIPLQSKYILKEKG
jgi:hypothetical protein